MTDLAPGCHLLRVDDGGWLCAAPGDRFVRIDGPDDVIGLAAGLDPTAAVSPRQHGRLEALLGLLRSAGLTATAGASRAQRSAHVVVEGGTPVAAAVAHQLSRHATLVRRPVDEDSVAAADVLVSCAGWLPDSRWQVVQGWCERHQTAWHRCHAEGDRFYVGPMWIPDSSIAGYDDVRARRLAASPVADQLLALWTHLDDGTVPHPAAPWPGRPGVHLLASLVAAEVEHYLANGAGALGSVQLEVDATTSQIIHHPVLPLPELTAHTS